METPLLEREQELSALDGLVGLGVRGSARLVLIEGTAGIGKSRLIAELSERARARSMRVLSAHGSDLEREFPFGVVRQLFEQSLAAGVVVDDASEVAIGQTLEAVEEVAERHAAGYYPNFVEHPADASAFFGPDTWARLREVKALYDPQDVFAGNPACLSR